MQPATSACLREPRFSFVHGHRCADRVAPLAPTTGPGGSTSATSPSWTRCSAWAHVPGLTSRPRNPTVFQSRRTRAPTPAGSTSARVELLRQVMARHGDGETPLWATAFGWNALPAARSPGSACPAAAQAGVRRRRSPGAARIGRGSGRSSGLPIPRSPGGWSLARLCALRRRRYRAAGGAALTRAAAPTACCRPARTRSIIPRCTTAPAGA